MNDDVTVESGLRAAYELLLEDRAGLVESSTVHGRFDELDEEERRLVLRYDLAAAAVSAVADHLYIDLEDAAETCEHGNTRSDPCDACHPPDREGL